MRGLLQLVALRGARALVAGRRTLSFVSAFVALSARSTSDPIAAGMAGAATARSALARPVSNAKRVSNNRKNRPLFHDGAEIIAPRSLNIG